MIDEEEIRVDDLAPDADEPGDDLPDELSDLVTNNSESIVPDNIDHMDLP